MRGIYKYLIVEELELIIQFYQGDIELKGLIALKKNILEDTCYNPNFRVLADIRLSDIIMSTDDVETYGNWLKENSNRDNLVAILTSTPDQTSKSMIFNSNEKHEKYMVLICSTLKYALEYLNIKLSALNKIESEIEKMIVNPRVNTFFSL